MNHTLSDCYQSIAEIRRPHDLSDQRYQCQCLAGACSSRRSGSGRPKQEGARYRWLAAWPPERELASGSIGVLSLDMLSSGPLNSAILSGLLELRGQEQDSANLLCFLCLLISFTSDDLE